VPDIHLTSIHIYPMKAARAVDLGESKVEPCIRIGVVPFRVAKPCGRCVVTTTDQVTGQRERQPLKMLGQRRRFGQELVFGQNLIPDAAGVIRVGDPVQILEAA
jgi:uncharacterized protein YcbX